MVVLVLIETIFVNFCYVFLHFSSCDGPILRLDVAQLRFGGREGGALKESVFVRFKTDRGTESETKTDRGAFFKKGAKKRRSFFKRGFFLRGAFLLRGPKKKKEFF